MTGIVVMGRVRRWLVLAGLVFAASSGSAIVGLVAGAASALAAPPAFTQVPGSPFANGGTPISVAFSARGGLLATANYDGNTVSVLAPRSGTLGPTRQTVAAPVTASRHVRRKVVMYDLFATGHVQPCCLFLHADTPTVIFGLKWKHWGSERAVAHGRWDGLNCGPCGPNPIRVRTPVIVTAERLVKCKPGLYAYRTVLLTIPDRKARTELGFPAGQTTTNIGLGGCVY